MLASTTITNTIAVVIMVSLRVGQVTFAASERTCCMKSNGFVSAISLRPHRLWSGGERPLRHACAQIEGARGCFQASRHLFKPSAERSLEQNVRFVDRWQ